MKYLTLGLVVIFSAALIACAPKPIRDVNKVANELQESKVLNTQWFEGEDYKIHYMSRGKQGSTVVVFIHGTPGNWEIFAHQLNSSELSDNAYLVAIDRPGWGQSHLERDELYTSLKLQADLIAPLLRELKEQSHKQTLILAGHSFGATLAPFIAMQYPELVDASVSYAGDLTSEHFKKEWYNEVASWGVSKVILPNALLHANDEVLALPPYLDQMAESWSEMSSPFIVYQGGNDSLVDKGNAKFAETIETNSTVEVHYTPELGHFIHLVKHEEVNQRLIELIGELDVRQAERKQ